jgi:hypothetical protein
MPDISYKEYVIHPSPMQLADTDEWNMEIYISKDNGSEIKNRKFFTGNTFKTKEEAIQHYTIQLKRRVFTRSGHTQNTFTTLKSYVLLNYHQTPGLS